MKPHHPQPRLLEPPHSHLRVGFFCPLKTEKNRVSVMRNVPRPTIQRPSMTDTTNPETNPITTLRTDQCLSLSGRSTLTYEIGKDPDDRVHLRVIHNTGKGHHNPSWVAYDAIEPLLMNATSLSASALAKLFAGTSVNTAGFVMAVLKHLGVVQAVVDKRHAYQYVEGADWKALLQAPAQPTTQPTIRPAKDDKARSKRAGALPTP